MMSQQTNCPLCGQAVDRLIYGFHRAEEDAVLQQISKQYPQWRQENGACSRCVDYYHTEILQEKRLIPEIGPHFPVRTVDDYLVIPTPLRMQAHPQITGRGITICMIDSGFYPHPDLLRPRQRILKVVDITQSGSSPVYFAKPHPESWHGTMTTVVCAGNGFLSGGLYRGIASQASLVLLKVQNEEGISGENIAKAIRWAIAHRQEYNIRIINLSVTDDWAISYKSSEVDQAAEEAINAGMVVVAAAGNDPNQPIKPPANAPNVITVGGVNDHNTLGFHETTAYHSAYGTTVDAYLKPEIIAPAIWIAAPILPETPEQAEARTLFKILNSPTEKIREVLHSELPKTNLPPDLLEEQSTVAIQTAVKDRIAAAKYISSHYLHADGTSFAAPITASIVAQMLEVNPKLTPALVREFIFSTAQMLPHIDSIHQGYGVVNAHAAVEKARLENHHFSLEHQNSPQIDYRRKKIYFYYHSHSANEVRLTGDFLAWSPNGVLFQKESSGRWKCEIALLPPGSYTYKFWVDKKRWISDPRNPFRMPDDFNGFNSSFEII